MTILLSRKDGFDKLSVLRQKHRVELIRAGHIPSKKEWDDMKPRPPGPVPPAGMPPPSKPPPTKLSKRASQRRVHPHGGPSLDGVQKCRLSMFDYSDEELSSYLGTHQESDDSPRPLKRRKIAPQQRFTSGLDASMSLEQTKHKPKWQLTSGVRTATPLAQTRAVPRWQFVSGVRPSMPLTRRTYEPWRRDLSGAL
jgi:hypothetical protein